MRASIIALVLLTAACTVEKKENVPSDSMNVVAPGATVIVPPAPPAATPLPEPAPSATTRPVAPSSARSRRDSTKSSPMPPKKMKIEPMVGGERDSAFGPVMGVGADGKLHPIKK